MIGAPTVLFIPPLLAVLVVDAGRTSQLFSFLFSAASALDEEELRPWPALIGN